MKREIQNILSAAVAMMAVVVASVGVMGSTVRLQFDMGRTPGSVVQSVSSPGLAVGPFTALDTTWNTVNTSVTNYTSLKYTDGTTATGVVAQYGSVGGTGTPTSTLTWNNSTDELDAGPTGDGGVSLYTGDNMVQFLSYYASFFNTNGGALGFQVSGLAPGAYDVYVTAVHPQALTRTYNIGIGVNLTQQVASPFSLTAGTTNTWQTGKNYALGSVTIGSTSDWISVISSNLNAFPEINGIQIVQTATPEPSSLALLGVSGLLLARRRRAARV